MVVLKVSLKKLLEILLKEFLMQFMESLVHKIPELLPGEAAEGKSTEIVIKVLEQFLWTLKKLIFEGTSGIIPGGTGLPSTHILTKFIENSKELFLV